MYARYPTQSALGPCKFVVAWKGGPYPSNDLEFALIDMKNWGVVAGIASGVTNVQPGELGMLQWTLPSKFQPTDDCPTVCTSPNKYGRYQVYVQDHAQQNWIYGPEFTITWSE